MRSSVDVRSSAGSGDADATGPNTAQFAIKQVGGSTKAITVADQLHLSRFAGDIIGVIGLRGECSYEPSAPGEGTRAAGHASIAVVADGVQVR